MVRDAATLAPIPNTDVQIYLGTSNVEREDTDSDGRISFTLEPGQYNVTDFDFE